jgi:hypothetical protein
MNDLLIDNVYLRGIWILLWLAESVCLVLMILNRKPGVSMYAACFKMDSLTERGMRARWWGNLITGIILFWIFDAVVFKLLRG